MTVTTSVQSPPPVHVPQGPLSSQGWRDAIAGLRRWAQASERPDVRAREIGMLLTSCPGVIASAYLQFTDRGEVERPVPLVCRREFDQLAPGWADALRRMALATSQDGKEHIEYLEQGPTSVTLLGGTVARDGRVVGVVCLVVPTDDNALPWFQEMLRTACAELRKAQAHGGSTIATAEDRPSWFDALVCAAREPSLGSAAQKVAQLLAERLGADRVVLGICNGVRAHCRLVAISGVLQPDTRATLATDYEEVMAEAVTRGAPTWIRADAHNADATTAVRNVMRACNAETVASGPLVGCDGRGFGAWMAVGIPGAHISPGGTLSANAISEIRQAEISLDLLLRAQPGLRQRLRRALWHEDARRRTVSVAAAVVMLIATLLVPWPYHVRCACEVQPVTRRYIPVPYGGVLKEVEVEPGDVVQAGQVLARMDAREIDWELVAKQAEYLRARKQHDISLASGLTADSQIAKLEMERLDVEIQLLRDRIRNLEIRSPIDGVLISGDPGKRRGARLTQGETLFEAGPLDRMLVEVYVPDREIAHVAEGQTVRVRLDAFPGRTFEAPVARISPSATPRDQDNVFVAEIELENPQHLMRPGMSGDGRIRTPRRALGWVLFHKAWQALVDQFR